MTGLVESLWQDKESEPQAADCRRERIARALYEHWISEDALNGCTYVDWNILPDKQTWYNRADAVISADPKKEQTP